MPFNMEIYLYSKTNLTSKLGLTISQEITLNKSKGIF